MLCTTISIAGYEACATGTDDDSPGPAAPFITGVPGINPGENSGGDSGDDGDGSTGAAVPALPKPTSAPQLVGGLVGLAMAFI